MKNTNKSEMEYVPLDNQNVDPISELIRRIAGVARNWSRENSKQGAADSAGE